MSYESLLLVAKGNYKVMFIAYDCDLQKLVILDNYEIKSNSKSKV